MNRIIALAVALVGFISTPLAAANIERVVSPGGIEAWLVRESTAPLVAMSFAFRGAGTNQDPEGREGTAQLVGLMMDEGAGQLDLQAFQRLMQDLSLTFSRTPSNDHFVISFRTLNAYRDEAFDLLRVALTEQHYAAPDLERMRQLLASSVRAQASNPNAVAAIRLNAVAFPNHPYGRPNNGTIESVAAVTRDDLVDFHRRAFARDNLQISVVGDIDPTTLGALLDRTFGGLPARNELRPLPRIDVQGTGSRVVIPFGLPQTIFQFVSPGIPFDDDDYLAATMVMFIFGGGNDTTRLWHAVRERRGLSYGASAGLNNLARSQVVFGATSTANETAGAMIETLEEEIRRMAAEGPTEEELERARTFVIGAYNQRFQDSLSIANAFLSIQLSDLGIDWIDRRERLARAVTLDQARRVSRRLFGQNYLYVLVGRPQGVTERRP